MFAVSSGRSEATETKKSTTPVRPNLLFVFILIRRFRDIPEYHSLNALISKLIGHTGTIFRRHREKLRAPFRQEKFPKIFRQSVFWRKKLYMTQKYFWSTKVNCGPQCIDTVWLQLYGLLHMKARKFQENGFFRGKFFNSWWFTDRCSILTNQKNLCLKFFPRFSVSFIFWYVTFNYGILRLQRGLYLQA